MAGASLIGRRGTVCLSVCLSAAAQRDIGGTLVERESRTARGDSALVEAALTSGFRSAFDVSRSGFLFALKGEMDLLPVLETMERARRLGSLRRE